MVREANERALSPSSHAIGYTERQDQPQDIAINTKQIA
jgi:hypothetical protein